MDIIWPDFRKVIKRRYASRVWLPVYLSRSCKVGDYCNIGYSSTYEGAHSLIVPIERRHLAENYGWSSDVSHTPWASEKVYMPSDEYWLNDQEPLGTRLVLRQTLPDRGEIIHLHHDFIIALGLVRECGVWVRPAENYSEVAREILNDDDGICGIEIKAEFLADYLAARNSGLKISTFRSQEVIVGLDQVPSEFQEVEEQTEDGRLDVRRIDLDASGDIAGAGVAVFKMSRNDVDSDEDVPVMGPENDQNTDGESWSFTRGDAKTTRLMADFWRDEWFEPGKASIRIRFDKVPSDVKFITEASGARQSADDLNSEDIGRWLWFRPDVIAALMDRRGAELNWYTRETGSISTPSDPAIHFGMNEIGLVTVYAYDIARLPEWERRFWAGHNVSPEGKVSSELLQSQVEAQSATTQAPEKFLSIVISQLRSAWTQEYGTELYREHDDFGELLMRCQRFRATDRNGLFVLAKDLARVTADLIDAKVAQAACSKPNSKWGSLKSLENAAANHCTPEFAHQICGPLFATYDLRLQDAHPPKSDIERSFKILGIDGDEPPVLAGQKMIHMVVSSIDALARVLSGQFRTEQ